MIRKLVFLIAAAAVALTVTLAAAPGSAQAVSYRKFQTVKDAACVRPQASNLDIRAEKCNRSPTTLGDWQVIGKGTYNNHPLWRLKNRRTGTCLYRGGAANQAGYLAHAKKCIGGHAEWWEVFTVKKGTTTVLVLKSYGAFKLANGRHECLAYLGSYSFSNVKLAGCNVNNTLQQRRR